MPETASKPSMGPRLVRLFLPLSGAGRDPWQEGRALRQLFGAPVALFSDPTGPWEICALGTAWAAMLPHEGRFAAAREALGRLREDSITLGRTPAVEGPTVLCAFAFEPRACGRPGPFGALGGGRMLLPHCLLLRATQGAEDHAGGVMLQLLAPDASGAALAAAQATLKRWAAAVQRLLGGPVAAVPRGHAWQLPPAPGDGDQAAYEAQVVRARAALGPGLHKVVLARCRTAQAAVDAEATAWALRAAQGRATAFSLALPGGGHFMGATPETLVRLCSGQVTTEALAGTAQRGPSPSADAAARAALLTSDKDLREHAWVVEGMAQALKPLVRALRCPSAPEALRLSRMWHLHTPIAAQAQPNTDVLALVEALHPTPALGGLPKGAGQSYLLQHEPWRRGLYAAPLGWLGLHGDGAFVAGIRSMWCDAHGAVLFAGAGIVAASDPRAEWLETELKLTTAAASLRVRPQPHEDAP